ncbi:FkbM family methyltransferase [Candidatus Pelagibacter communis]|uniref:Methyltransferase n=2 Tax=Pelagibacter ubique TaxID=198252 RepID=Q4FN85_PELUB|nr:FkbM family methyltransferase [Candidatus Pelagibacter ubique]AAZ21354.1 methyltransferase [Candidatus Pelagibacter ubique HTCC1062]EAS84784.1 methyltransferase [Candidatus Pelagibacter ubique HTCC1002]
MIKLLNILQKLTRKIPFFYYYVRKLIGYNPILIKIFYDKELKVLEKIKNKNLTIIDIGSNDGIFLNLILSLKIKVKKIFAFEPNPLNEFSLSKIDNKNLKVFFLGLGEKKNMLNLYVPFYKVLFKKVYLTSYSCIVKDKAKNDLNKSFSKYFRKKFEYEKFFIKIVKLDTFNLKPDFIKLVAGGFEYQIIKGSIKTLKRYKPVLYLDPHSVKVKKLLTNLGYNKLYLDLKTYKFLKIKKNNNSDQCFYIHKQNNIFN